MIRYSVKYYFGFFFAIAVFPNAHGQNYVWAFETGKCVIKHRNEMTDLVNSHPVKMEMSLQQKTDGSKKWHQTYNLPKIDYSLILIDYKNPTLGKTISSAAQLSYPFLKKNTWSIYGDIGIGAAYNTKPFDNENNHKNNVLSSKITGTLYGKIGLEKNITNQFGIHTGIGIIHFSNAAFTVPNLGINLVNINAGIYYDFLPSKNEISVEKLQGETFSKNKLSLEISNGLKEIYPTGGRKYLFNVVAVKNNYFLSEINSLSASLEYFYDRSIGQKFENPNHYHSKVGLALGHELWIGKVAAVLNYGMYLHQDYKNLPYNFYQRYGLKYQFHKNTFTSLNIKAHRGIADVLEWTIGFSY